MHTHRYTTTPRPVSRRGFLGISGFAVTGIAASGLLTACSTAAETKAGSGTPVAGFPDTRWDPTASTGGKKPDSRAGWPSRTSRSARPCSRPWTRG